MARLSSRAQRCWRAAGTGWREGRLDIFSMIPIGDRKLCKCVVGLMILSIYALFTTVIMIFIDTNHRKKRYQNNEKYIEAASVKQKHAEFNSVVVAHVSWQQSRL